VNRTYVYLVPKIMGETALSTWQNTDLFNRPCSITWTAKGDNMIAQLDWQEDGCLPD